MRLCNYPHFQSSAARSQPSDRNWCSRTLRFSSDPRPQRLFPRFIDPHECKLRLQDVLGACENRALPLSSKEM